MTEQADLEALEDATCKRVCMGESLRSICEEEGMPDEATASRWLELQADLLMDEIMDLADGVEKNLPAIAKARAQIDALKRRVEVLLNAVPPEHARTGIGG
ncbi:MAG: hypothetical protein IH855_03235 [Bacteroidetes bacterium]|nr:hypothetical protein [Bacteroidota bacterium]